jgi:hypothetical protein
VTIDAPGNDPGPLRALRGRVLWANGRPVVGAEVVLHSSPLPDFPRLAVARVKARDVTDAQGRFDLSFAPGGLWSLRVVVDGRPRASVTAPPAAEEMEIVLDRLAAALEVEAVDAATKTPVKLEALQLFYAGGHSPEGWIASWFDPGSRVRWAPVASGTAYVHASAEEHERVDGERVVLREGETTRLRLELHQGQTVRGTVLDHETGAPVPEARVGLIFDFVHVETDAQGAFELRRVPWDPNVRRTVEVRAAGYAPADQHIGDVPDGGVEELEFRLVRPATVALRCVDEAGEPLPDVLVVAETMRRVDTSSLGSDYATAVTGADGRASLTIAPGDYSFKVVCWRAGARVLERELPMLHPSELRELGDLVVGRPQAIRGVIFTAEGKPAAGASVAVVPHDPEDTEHDALAVAVIAADRGDLADAAGRFEVRGVEPGLWDLLVHGGGHPRLLRVGIAVPDRGDPPELELQLPVPVALAGRVVDAQGRGVPGARIWFLRSQPVAPNLLERIEADREGRFSIPGFTAEDRDVPLIVSAPGGSEGEGVETEATPRDSPVEIRLP